MAGDAVLSTHAELIQEFKDRKSGEWDPDYWICLVQGQDVEAVEEEEPIALVDRDQVVQSQEGDALLRFLLM